MRSCVLIDDDEAIHEMLDVLLTDAGFDVASYKDGQSGLDRILADPPDLVILDIMMPKMDGLEVCERLRADPSLAQTKIVMLSAKAYAFDRRRAFEFGVHGFLRKPIQPKTFADDVLAIMESRMTVSFWGVRGTLPAPGAQSVRYGGNTSCVTLELPRERFFIFDAGSGIKALSDHLFKTVSGRRSGKIFISHPHWDHLNAIPFFSPLYLAANEFEILGPSQGNLHMKDLVSAQMSSVYFPITMKEFAATVEFRDLTEGEYQVDGITVKTLLLTHPGYCLGYRVEYAGNSVCYVTDHELYPADSPSFSQHDRNRLTAFIKGATVLITDATYFDDEYLTKVDWGHSAITEVARLAHQAEVETLYLFHHDPSHSDDDIDRKLAVAQAELTSLGSKTVCVAPAERDRVILRERVLVQ